MTWVKLDDQWAQHPRMLRAGPLGRLLFVEILTYCARYLTDGEIPREAVAGLVDWASWGVREQCSDDGDDRGTAPTDNLDLAQRLVDVGTLDLTDTGYRVHDYLEYQRSRADVTSERAATAERVRKLREKRMAPLVTPTKRTSNTVTSECNAVTNTAPVPVPVGNGSQRESAPAAPSPVEHQTPKAKKGTRLPSDWKPSEDEVAYATGRGWLRGEVEDMAEDFRLHFVSSARPTAVKLDWHAAWQVWVRRENPPLRPPKQPDLPTAPRMTNLEMAEAQRNREPDLSYDSVEELRQLAADGHDGAKKELAKRGVDLAN